jgi:hypothetical protein
MKPGGGVLSELKRRRVIRVALGYLVVAWVAIQVVTSVFPVLLLPQAVTRAFVIVAIMGLPIAIALGWVFDVTPAGVKRTEGVAAGPDASGARRLGVAAGVAAGLTVAPRSAPASNGAGRDGGNAGRSGTTTRRHGALTGPSAVQAATGSDESRVERWTRRVPCPPKSISARSPSTSSTIPLP